MWLSLCTVLVALLARVIDGGVEPLQSLPEDLVSMFDLHHKIGDLTQQPAQMIFWHSLEKYMCKFRQSRPTMTDTEFTFLSDNVKNFMQPIYDEINPRARKKRQAQQILPRVRRDLYTMTRDERVRYFTAVIRFKRDRRLRPSLYDIFADFHRAGNIARAHFGPAFPAWHRLYLWLYESFLRTYDPTVTIPYWNSAADNEMEDPTQSPMWTAALFGNGVGEPSIGPFANWRRYNPARVFTRNVGGGPLYDYDGIDNIINRTLNSEILLPSPFANSNFEVQHGFTHVFCRGSMNNLEEATRDPVFFSHHCMVDQIWERFRFNQYFNGVNPELDYPYIEGTPGFPPEHSPQADMGFFPDGQLNISYRNFVGYSNVFFRLVQYERVPECNNSCNNSPFYECRTSINRCVTRPWFQIPRRFLRPINDPWGQGRGGGRVKRQAVHEINTCPKPTLVGDVNYKWLGTEQQSPSVPLGTQGLQNNDWVYILAKFVVKRNDHFKPFQDYTFGNINGQFGLKNAFLRPESQYAYRNCEKYQDVINKIRIVSYGLNYLGYAEEYALADNRLGVAVSYGFVPVKRPQNGAPSEAVIAAFDSCGRICRPYCKTTGTATMNMLGGIRVTNTAPLLYRDSYAESTLSAWHIASPTSCPSLDYNNIPLSFFCEYSDDWFWPSTSSAQGMASPNRGMPGPDPRLNPGLMVEPQRPQRRLAQRRRQRMGRLRGGRRRMGRGRRVGAPFHGNPNMHSFVADAIGNYRPGQI